MPKPVQPPRVPGFKDCEVFVVERDHQTSRPGASVLFPLKLALPDTREICSLVQTRNKLAMAEVDELNATTAKVARIKEPIARDLPAPQHVRERKCRRWLEIHGPDRPWVTVDDLPWLFTPGCLHLLTIHRAGFSSTNASHLHTVLQRLSS